MCFCLCFAGGGGGRRRPPAGAAAAHWPGLTARSSLPATMAGIPTAGPEAPSEAASAPELQLTREAISHGNMNRLAFVEVRHSVWIREDA